MNIQTKIETKTPAVKTEKPKRVAAPLCSRMKAQLSAAAFRNKVTREELVDLESHIQKLAGFLGT